MDMIVCQNLTKRFGALTAVEAMCLEVREGELFGFLGPNGAGKTTTIKMMTGLLHPTEGTAIIGGYDVQRQPLQAKSILGYIPDNPFLYEKLTGREYLNFMADLYSVTHQNRDRRMDDLLRLFELQDKGNELIQGYSRGMRQKIALAGALIHSPKVIFLDEPTVGLDPKSARTMRDILRELCRRGTTVFVSTHILEIAERMCDRAAIVNKGRLIALGTMDELRAIAEEARQLPGSVHRNGGNGAGSAQSAADKKSLEDIFLELTGGSEDADLIQYLG
ncbi:MAG TPA: ABC transporter ATP-binding protein [Chthonomonadaceae bacterium]|nr:ABC transporter ATP-binding protein [Chthonomonadaceae bacterium]